MSAKTFRICNQASSFTQTGVLCTGLFHIVIAGTFRTLEVDQSLGRPPSVTLTVKSATYEKDEWHFVLAVPLGVYFGSGFQCEPSSNGRINGNI
jgi:hypothetical protein